MGLVGVSASPKILLDNFRNHTCTDGTAAFTDGKTKALFHGDGVYQIDCKRGIVSRHDHLDVFVLSGGARDVSSTKKELRSTQYERSA